MLFVQDIGLKTTSMLPRISKGLLPVLLFWIFILCQSPCALCTVNKSIEKHDLVPSNLLKWGKWGSDYIVLVDKSQQMVMVYRSDNLFKPEKIYQCSTGENHGRKSVVNDKKTPEGIYFFTGYYTKEYLAPIYGAMALTLNYPNIFDIKDGRNGYGIWFHGTNKSLKPNDTNGCIALVDRDIKELASFVTLYNTPVIIISSLEMATKEELEEKAEDISNIIEGWRESWQNKDVDRYMSFYSRSFSSGNKNWKQWKDYKTRLTKKYKEIRVEIDDLSILINNNVVLASFRQNYKTPVFESSGLKRLYITKNSEEWKIIGETFSVAEARQVAATTPMPEKDQKESEEIKQVPLMSPQPGPEKEKTAETQQSFSKTILHDNSHEEIEAFINSWIDAWEKKDIKRYIASYDAKFESRNMNLDAWKRQKEILNKRYKSIKIEISDLKITNVSDSKADVSFIQEYRSDSYMDRGEKNMVLIKEGKKWKIKKEEWTEISSR